MQSLMDTTQSCTQSLKTGPKSALQRLEDKMMHLNLTTPADDFLAMSDRIEIWNGEYPAVSAELWVSAPCPVLQLSTTVLSSTCLAAWCSVPATAQEVLDGKRTLSRAAAQGTVRTASELISSKGVLYFGKIINLGGASRQLCTDCASL